jgi:light-regulated signal transduction histidine kinase (bacteriophytochrome)
LDFGGSTLDHPSLDELRHLLRGISIRCLTQQLRMLQGPIEGAGAKITHDPLPTIMAEETPLTLLFQNLIGNAIKYHRNGVPPQVHFSARREAWLWCFSVADNGIGIEAQHLKTIFAPFKRLHSLEEYSGSGIGLALCQKIVQRFGGQIWAESTYGRGSTFHFTIPGKGGDI